MLLRSPLGLTALLSVPNHDHPCWNQDRRRLFHESRSIGMYGKKWPPNTAVPFNTCYNKDPIPTVNRSRYHEGHELKACELVDLVDHRQT